MLSTFLHKERAAPHYNVIIAVRMQNIALSDRREIFGSRKFNNETLTYAYLLHIICTIEMFIFIWIKFTK